MSNEEYNIIRGLAVEALNNLNNCPYNTSLDISCLFDTNVGFMTYTDYVHNTHTYIPNFFKTDAYIILKNNEATIIYNEYKSLQRIRWSICHEFAHLYLGHKSRSKLEESEANTFAAELLMPTFALDFMDIFDELTINNISNVFNVSLDAAKYRLINYYNYKQRNSTNPCKALTVGFAECYLNGTNKNYINSNIIELMPMILV